MPRIVTLLAMTATVAGLCTTAVPAQEQKSKTTRTTKIELEGGKDVHVTGCLERTPSGDYILTNLRDRRHKDERLEHRTYQLVSEVDLSRHAGERVDIKGK